MAKKRGRGRGTWMNTRSSTPPPESRCERNDGKLWRCRDRRMDGSSLCQYHYEYAEMRAKGIRARGERADLRSDSDSTRIGRKIKTPLTQRRSTVTLTSDSNIHESSRSPSEDTSLSTQYSDRSGRKIEGIKVGSNGCGKSPFESSSSVIQDDVVPLSGKPFFSCILSKSSVQQSFLLVIPVKLSCILPSTIVPVILTRQNVSWGMQYYGDRSVKRFDSGWKKFALDNNLKLGDACVFELMESKNILNFQVKILDGQIPSKFVPREKGLSSETPIVID